MKQHGRSVVASQNPTPVAIDSLERRVLLSGNVTATADGKSLLLQITGDGKPNAVLVSLYNKGDGYLLTGLKGTTINGNASGLLQTNTAYNVAMNLGARNDAV